MGEFIFSAFIFSILGSVFWLFPGWYLLSFEKNLRLLERIFLSLCIGFSLFSLSIYFIRILGLPVWIVYLPAIFMTYMAFKKKIIFPIQKKSIQIHHYLLGMIMIGSFFLQGAVLYQSGMVTDTGRKFVELSAHDSLQHIYLINELHYNFPPRHPGFAPVLVKNYHLLMDVVLSSLNQYLPLSTYELYYRLYPAFVSFLSSLGIYVFVRKLTKRTDFSLFAVVLINTSGNAAWLLRMFMNNRYEAHANTFMLDPFIDLLQNPISIIVFPLMIAGIWGLEKIAQKRNMRWLLFSSMVFGVLIGFKAWAGVVTGIALFCSSIWLSISKKNHQLWLVTIGSAAIMAIIMFPIFDRQTAASPIYIPGWLLKHMMEDKDRLNDLSNFFLEQTYQSEDNWFRLVLLYSKQIALFILGNLWLKIIGVVAIIKFLKKPPIWMIFALSASIPSLLFPLLFNQGRMAYDIIQFGPYFIFFMGIFFVLALQIITKQVSKFLKIILIIIIIGLSFPSNWNSVRDRMRADSFEISNQELEMYNYVNKQTPHESAIMVFPSQRNDSTLLVAALSGRPTYFSGKSFSIITGENMQERKQEWTDFFFQVNQERRRNVIAEGNIEYLVLLNEEKGKMDLQGINYEQVFSNEETTVYRIK